MARNSFVHVSLGDLLEIEKPVTMTMYNVFGHVPVGTPRRELGGLLFLRFTVANPQKRRTLTVELLHGNSDTLRPIDCFDPSGWNICSNTIKVVAPDGYQLGDYLQIVTAKLGSALAAAGCLCLIEYDNPRITNDDGPWHIAMLIGRSGLNDRWFPEIDDLVAFRRRVARGQVDRESRLGRDANGIIAMAFGYAGLSPRTPEDIPNPQDMTVQQLITMIARSR